MASKVHIQTLGSNRPIDEAFVAIERDGGVIVRDFLDAAQVGALRRDLDAVIDSWVPGSRSGDQVWETFHGRRTKRICGLAARSRAFIDVLCDARMKAYGDHFLLPNCGGYWLNTGQLMVIGPGEPAQFLHRDEGNWPHFPWPGFELTVSVMFALSDFTEENGATVVAPGSHRWSDPSREPTHAELTQAVMSAGSALLYTGKVIHGAGANRTAGETRYGMHVSWVLGWLRPEENHYLAVPADLARTLPPRAQQVLGYTAYHPSAMGGRLGLVDFDDPAISSDAAALARPERTWTLPDA
jgi:ectoine hydroxylase-related dioxygenase (phytanoyl-CoA dioxygenase family)